MQLNEGWGAVPEFLSPENPMPLYYQLKEILLERIEKGEYARTGKLPSERELQEQFRVGRATVRQAINELAKRGIVIPRQGKGVFIAPPKVEQGLLTFYSFTREMLKKGFKPGTEVLDFERVPAPPSIAQSLELPQDSAVVVRLVRLRLANGEPLIYETSYLPDHLVPGLTVERVKARPLYDILTEDYGLNPTRAKESFEPVILDAREAKALGVAKGAPALLLERLAFAGNIPVEFCHELVRGDRCRFYVELLQR
ncbi:MAG TPA: GntR family transcriptional regulator [Firmicutes bacterium]|nr:GntR family transcriptional regulator [Bacillota bacterium]